MQFSPEFRLLLQLLNVKLGNRNDYELQQSIRQISSWERFVALVIRHRLVSLVYTLVVELNIQLTENAYARLKNQVDLERKKNFILNASLIQLNEVLEKEIDVLWFKGVVQSQRMYNNSLLRSYSDLDLYIKKSDLNRLDELLRAQGYMPTLDWKTYSDHLH
jgi:hypothetical protein